TAHAARRVRRASVSEAMLDHAIGGAETLHAPDRPADRAGVVPVGRHPRAVDVEAAARNLPRGDLGPFQRWVRHWFSRTVAGLIIKTWFHVEVVNPERFPTAPAVLCFNHLSWLDPLLILATFPADPRIHFYGPKQEDLRTGRRNRFMWWTAVPVPFSPQK